MLPKALCVANCSEEEQATYKIGAIKSYDFEALRLILGLREVNAQRRGLLEHMPHRVGVPIGQAGADDVSTGRAQQRFGYRICDGERSHAGGASRLDSWRRVFDDQTFAGHQR